MHEFIVHLWYAKPGIFAVCLWPLSQVYKAIVSVRKRIDKMFQTQFDVPVIVVGNLTVGGTGKTPIVAQLAKHYQQCGYRVGIVSRGYGAKPPQFPYWVKPDSPASASGDEPLLLAQKTLCPVVIDPKRVQACQYLLANTDCNLVLSDDGLQHYRLARDKEILVVDGQRAFGNGYCLPAGPLREPKRRAQMADCILVTGRDTKADITRIWSLQSPDKNITIDTFNHKQVHAMAGIAHPENFFKLLREKGITVIAHPKPDHYQYQAKDFDLSPDLPIIITEKDAVKCRGLTEKLIWVATLDLEIAPHKIPTPNKP